MAARHDLRARPEADACRDGRARRRRTDRPAAVPRLPAREARRPRPAWPKRFSARARARAASTSRSRGGAVVTSAASRRFVAAATSSTARAKAISFAFDGFADPLTLRTYCSAAALTSSSGRRRLEVVECLDVPAHEATLAAVDPPLTRRDELELPACVRRAAARRTTVKGRRRATRRRQEPRHPAVRTGSSAGGARPRRDRRTCCGRGRARSSRRRGSAPRGSGTRPRLPRRLRPARTTAPRARPSGSPAGAPARQDAG